MRSPSATLRGRAWLRNFSPDDRADAARLVDALRFVGETEFRSATIDILRDQIALLLPQGAVALHPVRNDPTYRSDPFSFDQGLTRSGSALIALNIAAEVCDSFGNDVLIAPDLADLRDGRVRNVIFVDDFIGSGRSVVEYIQRWRSHPTVRSWTSYHLIAFHLVAYSYTSSGLQALASSGLLDIGNVRTHTVSDDVHNARWTTAEREQILDVCRRYANNEHNALGYGGTGALTVFHHTVPNNLPRILLQDTGREKSHWEPFFPPGVRRLDPAQAAELMGYRPAGEALVVTGAPESIAAEQELLDRHLRMLLGAIANRARFTREVQEITGFTDFQVRHLLERAKGLGFITTGHALTEAGFAWTAEATARRFDDDEDEDAYYYPTQLRGADDF